jgi:hypothetical protein
MGAYLPLWKFILGFFIAGLLTRTISQVDMLYDWYTGEDERLGPPSSTLPLVTGLLSPRLVISFVIVETILCLYIAYTIFNPICFLTALLMFVWGVTYSASPPLKNMTEFQRRVYRSLSGLIVAGGVAVVAPEKIISWEAFIAYMLAIIGCLAYHDKDAIRLKPLTPKDVASFTVIMSIIEYLWLILVWHTFHLNLIFLVLYYTISIPTKAYAIMNAYKHVNERSVHIKLTHVGVASYTLMLILANIAAAFEIIVG